jgi:hypothetical protein|tara:strand:+ start:163 stop:297 length:135 start_codon:yes stop_codon:yes gene_type:complete
MKWRQVLRKEAVAVTTTSRPSLFRTAYSKRKKKDDEDGEKEESA